MPAAESMPDEPPRYRPNVAAIVVDAAGLILVCERSDVAGAWQFPQGGVHAGETFETAITRELAEELSLTPEDFQLGEHRGPYRYLFEPGRTKEGFHGQEQHYFQVRLTSSADRVNIETEDREFQAARWISPAEFRLAWVPPMKRAVYIEVFRDFFALSLLDDASPPETP